MFDKSYRVKAMHMNPTSTYDDPLAQYGFVAVKITEETDGPYKESYGDSIKFKHIADEAAITELVAKIAAEIIGRHVARYSAEAANNTPDGT